MSFRQYVANRRVTRTPPGDFVGDARSDAGLPDATTWVELKAYLHTKGAIPAAVVAAKSVWRGYIASKRRSGGGTNA